MNNNAEKKDSIDDKLIRTITISVFDTRNPDRINYKYLEYSKFQYDINSEIVKYISTTCINDIVLVYVKSNQLNIKTNIKFKYIYSSFCDDYNQKDVEQQTYMKFDLNQIYRQKKRIKINLYTAEKNQEYFLQICIKVKD